MLKFYCLWKLFTFNDHGFLTSKLLRDQASRVVKNKVVMATEYRNEQDTNIVPLQDIEILVEQHPQEDNMNKNLTDNTNVNVESDNNEIIETDFYKTLNDIFIQKINEYSTVDVNNRPYLTSINKKPSAEELKTIDFIATKYINSLKCNGDVTLDIKALSKQCSTNVIINGKSETFMSDLTRYSCGIFQGDSLSVLCFILAINPLSFLLNKLKGYKMVSSSNRNTNITHLFFVDDLQLYA